MFKNVFKNADKGFLAIISLLAVLALVILGYDIYTVAAGQVDLNQHLPFFLPIMLCVFIGIAIKIEMVCRESPSAAERARGEARRDSCLHPDNLPHDRAKDGSIE